MFPNRRGRILFCTSDHSVIRASVVKHTCSITSDTNTILCAMLTGCLLSLYQTYFCDLLRIHRLENKLKKNQPSFKPFCSLFNGTMKDILLATTLLGFTKSMKICITVSRLFQGNYIFPVPGIKFLSSFLSELCYVHKLVHVFTSSNTEAL